MQFAMSFEDNKNFQILWRVYPHVYFSYGYYVLNEGTIKNYEPSVIPVFFSQFFLVLGFVHTVFVALVPKCALGEKTKLNITNNRKGPNLLFYQVLFMIVGNI